VVDARKGTFTLTFDHNPTAATRTVIVLVTSPCGNTNSFVYSQEGDDSGCGSTTVAPKIKGENSTDLCSGGAVYLYLDGRPSGTYIWARNGVQVGTGTDYVATQAGIYIVYADLLGCTHVKPDTVHVTALSTSAPDAPVVVAENNGALCSAGGTVNLFAVTTSSGNVVWYHNGVRDYVNTGSPIAAGEGEWYAVIADGGCTSMQSNTVNVALDVNAGGGSIVAPTIEINETSVSGSATLCRGGTPTFTVTTPQADVIYTWYRNNTSIGTGTSLTYSITSDDPFILRCRATAAAQCPKETDIVVGVTSTRPVTPTITCNTPGNAICGGTATLTANTTGSVSAYLWYRSDAEYGTYTQIVGESSQNLVITQTGYYKVQTQDGICRSAMSAAKNIATTSGAATVTISGPTSNIHAGFTETYKATMNNAQGATYSWTVNPGTTGATPTSGTGSEIVLTFGAAGTATLSLTASNACGSATVTNNNYSIPVGAACSTPSITAHSPTSRTANIISGNTTSMNITASGSPTLSYQWYSNTSASTSGGSAIGGATGTSYTTLSSLAVGTHYFFCRVTSSCNGSTATSGIFTVTVYPNPATIADGTGTFTGRVCFDVAQTNNSGECGNLAGRQAETLTATSTRADFTNTITNTQAYTFKPSGQVSNVRFMYVDAQNIIASLTGGSSGNNISAAVSCTVVYNSDLNSRAAGTNSSSALTADIYVIYNDGATGGGTDRKLKLTPKIKDCACCGAYISATTWKEFMCHNLGADQTKDPFTPTKELIGAFYKWGTGIVAITQADILANPGKSWSSTLSSSGGTPPTTTDDWDMVNKNPCPAGFRVPTATEWQGVLDNNTFTVVGTTGNEDVYTEYDSAKAGYKFGNSLMLPLSGILESSYLEWYASAVRYWSSNAYDSSKASTFSLSYRTATIKLDNQNKTKLTSIRCIAE
jgi:uncharacterized protein (TIGR02145 family)